MNTRRNAVMLSWFAVAGVLSLCVSSGCTGMAKREVRGYVAAEHQRLESARSRVNDPMLDEYFRSFTNPLLAGAQKLAGTSKPEYQADKALDIYDDFRVYVVHDASPNAWTVGDDFACITTSAILFAEHPDELAFILAHEYGHMRGGHLVTAVKRKYATAFVAGMAAGLASGVANYQAQANPYYSSTQYNMDLQNARNLAMAIMLSYTPHQPIDEHDADEKAIELLLAAGLPIDRADKFFERMLARFGDTKSNTHPAPSARIARVRALMAKHDGYVSPLMCNESQFKKVQQRVRELTVTAMESGTLAFYSQERHSLLNKQPKSHLKACGPLYADPEVLATMYWNAVRGDSTHQQ
ncbi:MAG TPA: M48 family metallopeptidase [Phycisphaerales bacterium]|nr:M48 family metallopeptidase [Phycisphaerales bacterium]